MRTYTVGDTITLELGLRDSSGVSRVEALFRANASGRVISMHGDGGGEKEATVKLQAKITEEVFPDKYRCQFVDAYNTRGGKDTYYPDVRFRVQMFPAEGGGPELVKWRLCRVRQRLSKRRHMVNIDEKLSRSDQGNIISLRYICVASTKKEALR